MQRAVLEAERDYRGLAFNSRPAATAARSTIRAKPAVVNAA
jgi:hypothetical protein